MWEFLNTDRWTMLEKGTSRPPGRIDGRRRRPRKPGQPFVPRYKQTAAEADRRRKAGEGFDRLAREMKVSRTEMSRGLMRQVRRGLW